MLRLSSLLTLLFILFLPLNGWSQNCYIKLRGCIKDANTKEVLERVNIFVEEKKISAVTNEQGCFELANLCSGTYHLVLSHVGCIPKSTYVKLERDTLMRLAMNHYVSQLNHVVVSRKNQPQTTQKIESINKKEIVENAHQNLSQLLTFATGVSVLKNGNNIAKPVVHGLTGNRITILNNGVPQSGQQWGNDHSPEIDPLVANNVRIIKGTGALEYLGTDLGSVILVEPQKIGIDPHLHGQANYYFESNGLSNGINFELRQYSKLVAWKINSTIKKGGDRKTPNYFLNNTGNSEINFALQLEKQWNDKSFLDLYFSTFNTELGVLRGSHIGNVTDLNEAINKTVPFFTEPNFSYDIDAPKQKVNHHLLKLNFKHYIKDNEWYQFISSVQFNNRKEFDMRRGRFSDIPSLSLQQYSYYFEGKYENALKKDWKLKTGLQVNIIDNTNNIETNIFPLIPDYTSFNTGIFTLLNKNKNKSVFEFGLRYDFSNQDVVTISRAIPRRFIRHNNTFHNFRISGGWIYTINPNLSLSYNVGFITRNPAINELFSQGLHQGVSGIEEGNLNLNTEKSIKNAIGIKGVLSKKLFFDVLVFHQRINDFIYLEPNNEIRLTIRGAFPVFSYQQSDADIVGINLSGQYKLNSSILFHLKYSFLRGRNLSQQLPLVGMPSDNIVGNLKYQFENKVNIGNLTLENVEFEIGNEYVFKQNNLLAHQDFLSPPDGYYLLNFKTSTNIQMKHLRWRFSFKVDNVLNTTYRNYLNRHRYFADELGTNIVLGLSLYF